MRRGAGMCNIRKLAEVYGRAVAEAIGRGEQVRSKAHKYAQAVCDELSLDSKMAVTIGPIKAPDRIIEKAEARYKGDISKVGDVARLQILVDSPEQAKDAIRLFFPGRSSPFHKTMEDKGIKLVKAEDNFTHPKETGWIGLNIKLEADLGKGRKQQFEVQIIPSQLVDVYDTTHGYLQNIRSLKDGAKRQNRILSLNENRQIDQYKAMSLALHKEPLQEFGYAALAEKPPHSPIAALFRLSLPSPT